MARIAGGRVTNSHRRAGVNYVLTAAAHGRDGLPNRLPQSRTQALQGSARVGVGAPTAALPWQPADDSRTGVDERRPAFAHVPPDR